MSHAAKRKEFITVVVYLILPSGPTGKCDLSIINVLGNHLISFQMKKTKYNNIYLALNNMLWNEGAFLRKNVKKECKISINLVLRLNYYSV